MTDSSSSIRDAVLREARDRLVPYGWDVELESSEPSWIQLRVDHPLSAQFLLTMDGERDPLRRVQLFLQSREFSIIQRAPSSPSNASLMGLLRQRASGLRWPDDVIGEVAEILELHGILGEDEAAWLAEAGRPWDEGDEADADDVPAAPQPS